MATLKNSGDGHGVVSYNDEEAFPSPTTLRFNEDFDSTCSTPYVSAASSPGRDPPSNGYFFSAPASPMHFVLSSAPSSTAGSVESSSSDFEFSSRFSSNGVVATGAMSSADELFLNGQIRPMKLSSHLQRPQILAPLQDLEDEIEENDGEQVCRGRNLEFRSKSLHRKARSLSPLRNPENQWLEVEEEDEDRKIEKQNEAISCETTPSCSASSSRSSSSGRNSMKWIFLKDLLYRSKSEGRGNGKEKFQASIALEKNHPKQPPATRKSTGKPTNGVSKRRIPPSAHELHYTANRAQAEEMKKRTFLPYRQGLLGCLGFKSKGYGAISGLTRALNRPVSSS